MDNEKIPQIRDMTARCKKCGDYHFEDNLNKNGLCSKCANGNGATEDDCAIDWSDL